MRYTPSPLALLRSQSDERLARLAGQGHERAFEAIVERYRRPLYRQCRRVLTEARAEDAVQQAFLAAWTALCRGDDVVDVGAWLHRIARNSALNLARAPGFDYAELRDSLRIVEGPEEALERRAVVRRTLAGIAALPEHQRQALLRTVVDGADQDEIARDLGLSNGAVRQLVHRARVSLRAAATAVSPLPLVAWVASVGVRGEPMAQRIAEGGASGASVGAAATAAKLGAVIVVASGAVGAPAVFDHGAPLPGAAREGSPALVQRAAAGQRRAGSGELPGSEAGGGGGTPRGAGGDDRGSGASDDADRRPGRDHDDDGEHRRLDRNRDDDEDDRGNRAGDDEAGGSGRRGHDDEADRGGSSLRGDDGGDGGRGAGDDDGAGGGGDDPGGVSDGGDAETGAGTGSGVRSGAGAGTGSGTGYVPGEGDDEDSGGTRLADRDEERSAAPEGKHDDAPPGGESDE